MEKKKKNKERLKDYPFDRVKSRSKKHPLNIDGAIKIKDGLVILGDGYKTKNHFPIRFHLSILRDDCRRLYSLISKYPDYFVEGFEQEILWPALIFMNSSGARGKFKGKGTTLYWLRAESAELYELFSSLIKYKKSPSYFQKLLDEINKSRNEKQFYKENGIPDPVALTAICMQHYMKKMNEPLNSLGIRSFIDRIKKGELESFYTHYIKGEKPLSLYDIGKMSDQDIENISQELPFSHIFKTLQLL